MSSKFKEFSKKTFYGIENSAILITLFFIVLLPAIDMIVAKDFFLQKGFTGVHGSSEYLKHLMIWFTMLGAMISSREKEHISLAVFDKMIPAKFQPLSHFFVATVSATVLLALSFASYDHFVLVSEGSTVGQIPQIAFTLAFPFGFFVMAVRAVKLETVWAGIVAFVMSLTIVLLFFGVPVLFCEWFPYYLQDQVELIKTTPKQIASVVYQLLYLAVAIGAVIVVIKTIKSRKELSKKTVVGRSIGLFILVFLFTSFPTTYADFLSLLSEKITFLNDWIEPLRWEFPKWLYISLFVLLFISTALGTPIFITLAGAAALLFFQSEQMLGYLPNEAYVVLTDDIFPTIPLFTIAGFILSESKSGERLVAFFKALLGWMPGGLAIMAVLVSAFFTTFTGASGVTILALGGLLHYILTKDGYKEEFTEGYLTASGSIGLLFPPSLPIILYGVQAQISIKELFAGGLIPGMFLVTVLSVYAMFKGVPKEKRKRETFDIKEVVRTFRNAAPEVLLPLFIVVLFFTGQATLLQTSVIAVIYMLVVNLVIHRDFKLLDIPKVILKAAPIAGSVLIILAAAKGLSYYFVDAQVPQQLTTWMTDLLDPTQPSSKIIFLLLLNVALLVTGFFMDIFSAIIVVVPLILPLGEVFGIGPVHLGIIFLANLELGYLTPPVGLNLFLAAMRFKKPLVKIYKSVLPFLAILLIAVLAITYIPNVTYSGLHLFNFDSVVSDTTTVRSDGLESFFVEDTINFDTLGVITTSIESQRVTDTMIINDSSMVDQLVYKIETDTFVIDTVVVVDTIVDTVLFEPIAMIDSIAVLDTLQSDSLQ